MRRQDFSYHLPKHLIASEPTANRRDSRLLCLNGPTGAVEHSQFAHIENLLQPGDLLVMNDTRVIPARLFAQKPTGGQVEVLIERLLEGHRALVHMRSSRSPKPGSVVILQDGSELAVTGRRDALFDVEFPADKTVLQRLNDIGHMPLPPYIERADTEADLERYQTVYSREDKAGAVAAPTAGLHFDQAMIDTLKAKGVEQAFVTLHVGAGTFQPVKAEDVTEHKMHSEWIEVTPEVVEQVKATKARGGRVIAVGTTSVRCLETASKSGAIEPVTGDTDIFIFPGYEYKTVDALITNFHLPESTLIMLVSAFAGYQHTMAAYRAAVAEEYRFFSYGDAMFITHNPAAPAETISGAQE